MNKTMIRLGDICDIESGGTPSRSQSDFFGGEIPWAKIDDLNVDTGVVVKTTETITQKGLEAIRGRIFPPKTLLFAIYGSVGKMAWAGCELSTNQAILGIKIREHRRVDENFLYRWLESQRSKFELNASGVTQKNLSAGYMRDLPFPALDIDEQRQVAVILDKADAIRRKRFDASILADKLLHSTFIHMFGDPVSNPMSWNEEPIGKLSTVTTGNTPSREVLEYYGDFIEWIKSDNINTAGHYLTKSKEGLSETGAKIGRKVSAGSTLITCIAGSPSCIGNAALADRTVAFNQQINALTPINDIEPLFLYSCILFSKKRIQAASTSGMKGMVSKGILEQVRLICPPKPKREAFVRIFEKIISMQKALQLSQQESEKLFASLSSQSFPDITK